MLTLISPAKKVLNIEQCYTGFTTEPVFKEKTAELLNLMQSKSPEDIAQLMHISEALAALNYQRYQNFAETQPYPALFLFQGDVYKALKAAEWDKNTIDFAQSSLMILSGLYGLLRPLDLIHPYRLEMGVRLANKVGKNLYDYWTKSLSKTINNRMDSMENPLLINLASMEYSKAVDTSSIQAPVINIHFMQQTDSLEKVPGIHAKKARGAMAAFIMRNQIDDVEHAKQFGELHYHYSKAHSDKQNLIFIRKG